MRLPPFSILEPVTQKNALSLLNKYKNSLKVMAGGTELVVLMKLGLFIPSNIMGLSKIKKMRGIKKKDNSIIIGSSTTIRDIIQTPLINKEFKAIVQAARLVAAPPIQNRATIGGNILQNTRCIYYNQSEIHRNGLKPCHKAGGDICHAVKGGKHCFSVYQGDMAPALISFNAKVKLEKEGSSRTLPVEDLFTGKGVKPLSIKDDELLTQIILPLPKAKCASFYEKFRIRRGLEYPLASVAVCLPEGKDGTIENARVVIGAAGSSPKIVEKAASLLQTHTPSVKDFQKISDLAGEITETVNNLVVSGAYRRKIIKVLTIRVLHNAYKDLRGTTI